MYYVGTSGDDTKTGNHPQDPYATVAKALSVATAGDTVYIYPGTYQEVFPLTIPAGVAVKGTGLRSKNNPQQELIQMMQFIQMVNPLLKI